MTALEALLVLVTGFGAGVLSSTVGVASLLSFPVLVALGLPPVVANVSNTLGMIPAGLGGVVGYREEVREGGRLSVVIVVVCAVGAVLGAALLLGLPAGRLRGDRPVPDPLHLPARGRPAADRRLAARPPRAAAR